MILSLLSKGEMNVGELAERGYNAVRIDVMPQFVVSERDGKITEGDLVMLVAFGAGFTWGSVLLQF